MLAPQPKATQPAAIDLVLLAVRQAADILCDRWTMSVLVCAFSGISRFNGFREHTGMASRQLTLRLKALESQGILVRMPYSMRPKRFGTHLTTKGEALFDVMATMIGWEIGFGIADKSALARLESACCDARTVRPQLVCQVCDLPVVARDVQVLKPNTKEINPLPPKKTTFRRASASRGTAFKHLPIPEAIEIVGDKWTIEVLVIVFMRVSSFVEIQRLSGISTNVLSDRLNRLRQLGMLRQMEQGETGRIGTYRITEKGTAFYPILLALQAWADQWLSDRIRSPLRLEHLPCGKSLNVAIACDQCGSILSSKSADVCIGS